MYNVMQVVWCYTTLFFIVEFLHEFLGLWWFFSWWSLMYLLYNSLSLAP